MKKLTIFVPSDSVIELHLSSLPHLYSCIGKKFASTEFSYGGAIPPLAKTLELLAMFQPDQYTIIRRKTGVSFIVCP